MVYEQPRLIRFADVIDWSQGGWDEPFAQCNPGPSYAGYPDCTGGSGAVALCFSGPNTSQSGCVTGNRAQKPTGLDKCANGFVAGPNQCTTGSYAGHGQCQAGSSP